MDTCIASQVDRTRRRTDGGCRTDAAAASGAAHYSYWASALHMAHLGGGPDTLVVYIYSNSDPEYEHNLEFFVRHGMREGDSCEYIIAVQHVRR